MNDYDLLGLMDTWKAMKASNVQGLPTSFAEALTGLTPVDTGDITIPQITQGNTTQEGAEKEIERRDRQAKYVTNDLGVGTSRLGSDQLGQFIPGDRQPLPTNKEAMDHKKRLDVRREIGF